MAGAKFRVWFGDREASEDELARIEEIEVTQEVDRFWEARVRTVTCLDAQGRWRHRPDEVGAAFTRLRVELDPGNGSFVALIDGPISNLESRLDSQPGRSSVTFAARDDSVLLNREEANEVFRDSSDSDIADQVLRSIGEIAETRIEATPATNPVTTRRGTRLAFLAQLARANERRVYVLPGEQRGRSVGCFLPDPTEPNDAYPTLVLNGDARNLAEATIEEDAESPERATARTLRLSDGSVAAVEADAEALGISGDRPAVPAELTALRQLPPEEALREDSSAAAAGRAREAGYAYKLSSRVIPGCYPAVLMPYQRVRVECGASPYSGSWLVTKVVHRITPSLYSQQFEAKGNGSTEVSAAPVAEVAGGGLSVSFSASVGVF
jgi:hypothetical protein